MPTHKFQVWFPKSMDRTAHMTPFFLLHCLRFGPAHFSSRPEKRYSNQSKLLNNNSFVNFDFGFDPVLVYGLCYPIHVRTGWKAKGCLQEDQRPTNGVCLFDDLLLVSGLGGIC